MTLKECADFCNDNEDLIGKVGAREGIITSIIPAPKDQGVFEKFLEYWYKTGNYTRAAILVGASDFSPLALYEKYHPMVFHSWLHQNFPERISPEAYTS